MAVCGYKLFCFISATTGRGRGMAARVRIELKCCSDIKKESFCYYLEGVVGEAADQVVDLAVVVDGGGQTEFDDGTLAAIAVLVENDEEQSQLNVAGETG